MSLDEQLFSEEPRSTAERIRPTPQIARRRGVADVEMTPTPEECRDLRGRLGWSTSMLAAKAGLKARTVIEFELQTRTPQHRTLIAIRRAFRSAGLKTGATT